MIKAVLHDFHDVLLLRSTLTFMVHNIRKLIMQKN